MLYAAVNYWFLILIPLQLAIIDISAQGRSGKVTLASKISLIR